jgi:site-specific DNA-methyltransferase (cytosine-N4-specific)
VTKLVNISLFPHGYRYFPYEKALALKELEAITGAKLSSDITEGAVCLKSNVCSADLQKLVYFEKFSKEGADYLTVQARLEQSAKVGQIRRQATRYSAHGIHEYKGKFNPQIVRAILNILKIGPDDSVIDPFCGSGTALLESAHAGISAVGTDINPLAVFIANEKQRAVTVSVRLLSRSLDAVLTSYRRGKAVVDRSYWSESELNYLENWFSPEALGDIDCLRRAISRTEKRAQGFLFVIASDLLRDYSLQEPADLRIRRRRTPIPTEPLIERFGKRARKAIENIRVVQPLIKEKFVSGKAILEDNRDYSTRFLKKNKERFAAAISSPPYATALPYIDTQRLSLVWLRLCEPKQLKDLEMDLTGSREITKSSQRSVLTDLVTNDDGLPQHASEFCQYLANSVGEKDGFRRQAVPALLFRYLKNMQSTLANVHELVSKGGHFALVVGSNSTTLNGSSIPIDTPNLLTEVAVSAGWQLENAIPLQTYARYGLHAANAVRKESLVILAKP